MKLTPQHAKTCVSDVHRSPSGLTREPGRDPAVRLRVLRGCQGEEAEGGPGLQADSAQAGRGDTAS